MRKIALLCPSKERLNRKLTLISSIITTVRNPDNITLYLGIDREGDSTMDTCQRIMRCLPFVKIIILDQAKCQKNIHKCWNVLADAAYKDGCEVLGLVADDMIFRTKDWDEKILEEFDDCETIADKWKLVTCNDLHKNGELPINYFVHRTYYEVIGYIACDRFVINWCDNWIKCHFDPFDRYIYRPDIVIEHAHWVFSGNGPDAVGKEMMAREQGSKALSDDLWAPLEPIRVEEVMKISKLIGIQPKFHPNVFSKQYWN